MLTGHVKWMLGELGCSKALDELHAKALQGIFRHQESVPTSLLNLPSPCLG